MNKIIQQLDGYFRLIIFSIRRPFVFLYSRILIVVSVIKTLRLLNRGYTKLEDVQPLQQIRPDLGHYPQINCFVVQENVCDLSIIIPIYNSERFIDECLESVLFQKTDFVFEVILINDGSTDSTIEHIKKYLSDSRIKLIEQDNHGQAYARNRAIEQSSGKYIMMVDSDDILIDDCVESLLSVAINTHSDIAEGIVKRFDREFAIPMNSKSTVKVYEESSDISYYLTAVGYSVAKVFKRELWETLRYPEGYIFEDVITKFILRRKAKRIAVINKTVYCYRRVSDSSSHGNNYLKKLDSIWVLPRIIALCEQESVPKDKIFYLLALNHIGLLNYVITRPVDKRIVISCFYEMQKQLISIQLNRPIKIPYLFRLVEQSIIRGNIDAWQEIASTIIKYNLLKKWREIN